ncbi:MAG: histidine phosphatase family protein, partial [Candidatus Kariarchaeaceae archaeon]
ESALPFSSKFEIPINKTDLLNEVYPLNFMLLNDFWEYKKRAFNNLDISIEQGESFLKALARITKLMKTLDNPYVNKNILVVSHGTILTLYFSSLLGILGNGNQMFELWKDLGFCQIGVVYNNKIVKNLL